MLAVVSALIALFVGATCIAMAPIFAVLGHDWGKLDPTVTAMWRTLLAAPLFALAFALVHGRRAKNVANRPRWSLKRVGWLSLPGLVFAVDLACWHASMTRISAGVSTFLANLAAVLVPLGAWLLFKERFGKRFVAGASLAVVSCSLLLIPPGESILRTLPSVNANQYVLGGGLALLTAFWYSALQLLFKHLRRTTPTLELMLWVTTVTSAALLLLNGVLGLKLLPDSPRGWWPLIGLALIPQCVGQALIVWSLGRLSSSAAAVSLLWQPVASTLLGYWVLGQELSLLQIGAIAPVLLGLGLVAQSRVATAAKQEVNSLPARPQVHSAES